jgi:hypothetical protein
MYNYVYNYVYNYMYNDSFILYSECCLHADQILPKFSQRVKVLSWPDLEGVFLLSRTVFLNLRCVA